MPLKENWNIKVSAGRMPFHRAQRINSVATSHHAGLSATAIFRPLSTDTTAPPSLHGIRFSKNIITSVCQKIYPGSGLYFVCISGSECPLFFCFARLSDLSDAIQDRDGKRYTGPFLLISTPMSPPRCRKKRYRLWECTEYVKFGFTADGKAVND